MGGKQEVFGDAASFLVLLLYPAYSTTVTIFFTSAGSCMSLRPETEGRLQPRNMPEVNLLTC